MEIHLVHGVLGLSGSTVDQMAETALRHIQVCYPKFTKMCTARPPYHITLFTKEDLRAMSHTPSIAELDINPAHVFAAGIGVNLKADVLFVVVLCIPGQQIRKRFGLPPKQFHITLSKIDKHDIDKGISSLLPGDEDRITDESTLDHLVLTLQLESRLDQAEAFALRLCHINHQSEKAFLRLADCAMKLEKHKLAMLAYACAYARDEQDRIREYCTKKILACAQNTEWGPIFIEHELAQLPSNLTRVLTTPWTSELRADFVCENPIPNMCLDSRERLLVPSHQATRGSSSSWYKLPRFFRWVVPFYLALMSTPRNAEDIRMLAEPSIAIRHVITLTEEQPLDRAWFCGTKVKYTYLPIPNYYPPTIEQMDLVIRMLVEGDHVPVLIHCGGGKGRAGTVAACYLVAFGFRKPSPERTFPSLSALEAVNALRAIRPGSIETEQQEAFVSRYASTVWKRQSILPELAPEPAPSELGVLEGTFETSCDLVMLIGLPGSGKSWICGALLARNPRHWTCISQDESGSRASCENQIGHTPPKGTRILLDRCNTSVQDRKSWLALASHWAQRPVAIWLDYPTELCMSRAQNRAGHPTLPPGGRVRAAIEQAQRIFTPPSCTEGFSAVLRVSSFAAAGELVRRLSPPVGLLKFPRTPHLLNLGAVSEDDVVEGNITSILRPGQRVFITEKVDGANMGFSLDSSGTRVLVQNRSHYVQPDTHAQFHRLGAWVERHYAALVGFLGRDKRFLERFVLYGEWLAATHSIPYEKLPDLFLAFDLYDRATETFIDRQSLEILLGETDIRIVPVVEVRDTIPTAEELRNMVQQPSRFYPGRLEGVYVKIEETGQVVQRGKVVRGDFIAGNEHWTKGRVRNNGIDLHHAT